MVVHTVLDDHLGEILIAGDSVGRYRIGRFAARARGNPARISVSSMTCVMKQGRPTGKLRCVECGVVLPDPENKPYPSTSSE